MVGLETIASQVGTPAYVYSKEYIVNQYKEYTEPLASIPNILCYAIKANSNLEILRLLNELGSGAEVVSGGELFRCLKAGIDPKKIVYSGVGKSPAELEYAIKSKVLMINIESETELRMISKLASENNTTMKIGVRFNPNIQPETHPYISTGLKEHKFGFLMEQTDALYGIASKLPGVEIAGIQTHIGSQIINIRPFIDSFKKTLLMREHLVREGFPVEYISIGGGLGIAYEDETPTSPKKYMEAILKTLDKPVDGVTVKKDFTLISEPGRSLVGNGGCIVTRVIAVKERKNKKFIIIDAGMNDLMRPALYSAHHKIVPNIIREGKIGIVDVAGPVCETGDTFARGLKFPPVEMGDLLIIHSAGAYGFSMASNYNSRPKPVEVLVDKDNFKVIRKRETYDDLIRGEL